MGLFNCFFAPAGLLPPADGRDGVGGHEYVTVAPWVAYPYARGRVHVSAAGPGIDDGYEFETGWLDDDGGSGEAGGAEVDLKSHVWGYKVQRRIARGMEIFRGELKGGHPDFREGSKARVVERAEGPIYRGQEDEVEYDERDDEAIERYVRGALGTARHPMGTCKMADRERGGVGRSFFFLLGVQIGWGMMLTC